ncbi:hypothetical protein H4219_006367, partial [Mycoemilia scoparia]
IYASLQNRGSDLSNSSEIGNGKEIPKLEQSNKGGIQGLEPQYHVETPKDNQGAIGGFVYGNPQINDGSKSTLDGNGMIPAYAGNHHSYEPHKMVSSENPVLTRAYSTT